MNLTVVSYTASGFWIAPYRAWSVLGVIQAAWVGVGVPGQCVINLVDFGYNGQFTY